MNQKNFTKPKLKESQEQQRLFCWARNNEIIYPELAFLFHVPNGGKRNAREAVSLKREGVKAGVPDVCLPVSRGKYHGLFIEMKVGKNKTTEHQDKWLEFLEQNGYAVDICYSAEKAAEIILKYLKLKKEKE